MQTCVNHFLWFLGFYYTLLFVIILTDSVGVNKQQFWVILRTTIADTYHLIYTDLVITIINGCSNNLIFTI